MLYGDDGLPCYSNGFRQSLLGHLVCLETQSSNVVLIDVDAISDTASVIKQPSNRHRHFRDNEEQ